MAALIVIAWFVCLLLSIWLVFNFVGAAGLVRMFPEGWRWWLLPVQWLSLAFFAAMVLINPFMKGGA